MIEQAGHGTVTIGSVEKYITETAWDQGWVKPAKPPRELKASVGIIGAGPAGLAAGEELRRKGYQVTIYDRYDRVGGLMIYGIPNFKLEKDVVERRAKLIADGGVTFKLNFEVGRDATLEELRAQHAAVLVATGVYKARDVKVPGIGLPEVFPALDYLIASNRKGPGRRGARFSTTARWMPRASMSSWSAAATRRWTACAPPCDRAPSRSSASIAATASTCPAPSARCATPRRRASSSSGSPRRKR